MSNGPEPPILCRVCGLPVPAPSMGGPDLCPACDCGVYRDGTPWDFKETMNPALVRERAHAREEDGFGFLHPPRARPLRLKVLATLKSMNERAQDADQVEDAQALCVAIECIEQLPRLRNATEPAEPYRRGANWKPSPETLELNRSCFFGRGEVCALCGKHIREHFGGTEYRCNPNP